MRLTVFHIKILAIVFMIIDHVGYVFFPQVIAFRIIGRLAFPLFAWLIANGAIHTHDMKKYLLRIFLLAVISQIPYILLIQQVDPGYWDLNAIFSLFIGLVGIACIQGINNYLVRILIIMLCALIGNFFTVDYGAFGVLSVIFFYVFFHDLKKMVLSQIMIYTLPTLFILLTTEFNKINIVNAVEPLAVLAVVFIVMYKGKEGPRIKWLFYSFYPLHFFVLYLIK